MEVAFPLLLYIKDPSSKSGSLHARQYVSLNSALHPQYSTPLLSEVPAGPAPLAVVDRRLSGRCTSDISANYLLDVRF